VRAVGSVRASAVQPAQRLGVDAGAPVDRAGQWVRDAIERRVPDARAAGVLAALAVGDQAAIERSACSSACCTRGRRTTRGRTRNPTR
jgi:competence protein ComEC